MRSKSVGGWDLLLALSVVGILVSLWFAFFVPKPIPVRAKTPEILLNEARGEGIYLEERVDAEEKGLLAKTWNISAASLGSEILAAVTKVSREHGLQVADFRSGRLLRAANLWEASFSVVLEGPFMDVMAAIKKLERPESKLAVSQLKLTSKSNSDHVMATLGLTGFLFKEGQDFG